MPGLGSVGGVSYIVFDNSIRNHVFADRDPKYGYDLRDRIIHRRRTTEQRQRKPKRSVSIPNVPNSQRIYNQAVYREIFNQRQYKSKRLLPLTENPKPTLIKKGGHYSKITFEQAIYKKVIKKNIR